MSVAFPPAAHPGELEALQDARRGVVRQPKGQVADGLVVALHTRVREAKKKSKFNSIFVLQYRVYYGLYFTL